MTAPKQGKLLLSDEERRRLFDKDLDTATRKRNNLIVKRKIKNWLNQAEDVVYALQFLTDTQIEQTIPDNDVFALFEATEMILDRLNFAPVKGDPDNPYVDYAATVLRDFPKAIRRRAKHNDFDRVWRVQNHVEALKKYYPSNPDEESLAYRSYREKKEQELPAGLIQMFPIEEQTERQKKDREDNAKSKKETPQ